VLQVVTDAQSNRLVHRHRLDLERVTLGGIDTLAVREWIAGLVEQGLSPSRIRNAYQVLSQIMSAGVEGGRITRNPAAGVRLPRIVRRDMHLLTARQVCCEVGESATEVDGRLVWGSTKTYARRIVHLPRFLCEQLAAYLA
jgi:hypothetical protein